MSGESSKPPLLVVDDNEHVLKAMRVVLMRHYTVHCCNDPEMASQVVAELRPHVIVLDIRMPRRDGFWVYDQIRKINEHVPIIFNSAFQDAMDYHDVMNSYRPYAYLAKGSDMTEFLKVIDSAARAYAEMLPLPE